MQHHAMPVNSALLQVARQEGEYLARLLKQHNPGPQSQGNGQGALPHPQKPFKYTHLGSLAYVGADKAVMDIPKMGPVTGWTAGQLYSAPSPPAPPLSPAPPPPHPLPLSWISPRWDL